MELAVKVRRTFNGPVPVVPGLNIVHIGIQEIVQVCSRGDHIGLSYAHLGQDKQAAHVDHIFHFHNEFHNEEF